MGVSKEVRDSILKSISELGGAGATILDLEEKVKFERHTLSKYLSILNGMGLVNYTIIGKAKVWSIAQAPLHTVLQSPPKRKTFAEKVFSDILISIPNGIAVIDRTYSILFMNRWMIQRYGKKDNSLFYESILGLENPISLKQITNIIENKESSADITIKDTKNNFLRIKASRIYNPDTSFSILLTIEDISEYETLIRNLKTKNTIFESERDALNRSAVIDEIDAEGKFIFVNDHFVDLFGYEKEELIGKKHKLLDSQQHSEEYFKKLWETVNQGHIWRGNIKLRSKTGQIISSETIIAPILDKNNKPIKFLSIRFNVEKE